LRDRDRGREAVGARADNDCIVPPLAGLLLDPRAQGCLPPSTNPFASTLRGLLQASLRTVCILAITRHCQANGRRYGPESDGYETHARPPQGLCPCASARALSSNRCMHSAKRSKMGPEAGSRWMPCPFGHARTPVRRWPSDEVAVRDLAEACGVGRLPCAYRTRSRATIRVTRTGAVPFSPKDSVPRLRPGLCCTLCAAVCCWSCMPWQRARVSLLLVGRGPLCALGTYYAAPNLLRCAEVDTCRGFGSRS
jgi:hypothetical protein